MAITPFDANQGRKYQKESADYSDLPFEEVVTLSGGEKLTMVLIPPGEFLIVIVKFDDDREDLQLVHDLPRKTRI